MTTKNQNGNHHYVAHGNITTTSAVVAADDCFSKFVNFQQSGSVHNGMASMAFAFVACFVVLTNTVVVLGVVKRRVWRVKSMRLFFLLIMSDLTIGLVTLPLHVVLYAAPNLFVQNGCGLASAVKFFRLFPVTLSIIGVFFISVDRYFAIMKARVHTHYASNRFVLLVIIVSVVVAFVWAMVNYSKLRKDDLFLIVSLVTHGIINVVIFISVSVLYCTVMKSVKKTANTTRISFMNAISTPPKYDRTFSRITVTISVSFILCHLPMTIAYFYLAFLLIVEKESSHVIFYLLTWSSLPMYFNSGVNGVLLLYGNQKLKRWFLRMCLGLLESSRPRHPSGSPAQRSRKNAIVNIATEQKTIEKVVIAFHTY